MTIRGQAADGVPDVGTAPAASEHPGTETAADAPTTNGARVPLVPPIVPESPPPEMRYRRAFRFKSSLTSLWKSRMIVWSLTIRDLRSTYSQEILGFAWALLTPLVHDGRLHVPPGPVQHAHPHRWRLVPALPLRRAAAVDVLLGLGLERRHGASWATRCSTRCTRRVRSSRSPRSLGTIVSTRCAAVGAPIVLFVLAGRVGRRRRPTGPIPLLLILLVFTARGLARSSPAITVYLRDMRHALPACSCQLGLFVTPILYGAQRDPREVPDWSTSSINPIAAIIDGLRRCVLYGQSPAAAATPLVAGGRVAASWLVVRLQRSSSDWRPGFADVCLREPSRSIRSGSGSGPTAAGGSCATTSAALGRRDHWRGSGPNPWRWVAARHQLPGRARARRSASSARTAPASPRC